MTGIIINIKAGATAKESSVTYNGQQVNIIADSERASFGIGSDADLKRAVGNYFPKTPHSDYLRSSTPVGDTYSVYGWEQVQRVLVPKKAEILNVTSTPTIVAREILKNDSSIKATFSKTISEQVTNSVSNQWSNSSKISVGQKIKYDIGFLGTGGGGETTFGYEHTWGKSETVSKQTTLGSTTGLTVELKPGESAIAELSASSGKMRVRITYEAYLTGSMIFVYNRQYEGHYTWKFKIEEVLGSSNRVQITEDIEVGYYCNGTANLKNA